MNNNYIAGARLATVSAMVVLSGLLAACGSNSGSSNASSGSGSGTGPIVIGLATAKSGAIAAYDEGPDQAIKLRAKLINDAGGVDGRKLKIIEGDTQSDKSVSPNVATDLIQKGAKFLVVSCDFDYGSPAAIVAAQNKVPALSQCASDPKFSDTKTLGKYAFTFAPGTDVEGTVAAEFAKKKGWTKAYVLQDQSIEYTKSTGRYFLARWKALGGKVVGQDTFTGAANLDVRPQITKMGSDANGANFVYLPSWNPAAATAIRQMREAGIKLPVLGDAAIDGRLMGQVAGKVSDVYPVAFGCFDFCKGGPDQAMNQWAAQMKQMFGQGPAVGSSIAGDTLVRAVVAAVKKAGGSTDGPKLQAALQSLGPVDTLAGTLTLATPTCHKPVAWPMYIQDVQSGVNHFVQKMVAAKISDLHDGNGCASK